MTDRETIESLRTALHRLMETTGTVRTTRALEARRIAHSLWVSSASEEAKAAALTLARERDSSIPDFDAAIIAYGSSLLYEVPAR